MSFLNDNITFYGVPSIIYITMIDDEDTKKNDLDQFIQHIISFGLTHEEAKVYLSLLKRGTRGEVVGRIKNELEIGRTTIYAIMERLNQNGWVFSEEISLSPRRVKYIAKPPLETLNQIIKQKQKELEELRQFSLFIGDELDKRYQGAKKLTIDTIHVGGYKYLKPLVDQEWTIKSEVIERGDILGDLVLDYELKGPKGFPKDCGLIIAFYDKNIENDNALLQKALKIFKSKSEYEIRKDKIPGFEDVKMEDTTFNEYLGANVYIKLKLKKKWWLVGKTAVIPLKNKLFLIFGNEKNFKILMDKILKAEDFHHLI